MRCRFLAVGALAVLCFTSALQAGAKTVSKKEAQASLRAAIDQIVSQVDDQVHVGVEIVELKTHSTLYAKNSRQLFMPSGVADLFVAAVGLELLPPDQLEQMIGRINKGADNAARHHLLKKLAQARAGRSEDWTGGSQAVRAYLRDTLLVDVEGMVLLDGDEQLRYNLASPHQIVELLVAMSGRFQSSAEFMASLAISGIDGTMKNRLQEANCRGRVRAKEGSQEGSSALAGYVESQNGKRYAFAILLNNFPASAPDYKAQVEDAICRALVAGP